MMRKPKGQIGGRWVFVADDPETARKELEEHVWENISCHAQMGAYRDNPFSAVEEFHDYFPGSNEVPKEGAWIMVTQSPGTEYTVPPFSFWFATPWPFDGEIAPQRVKIITPRGELGLFPREYSIVKDPAKFYEFVGRGMTMRFFGGAEAQLPADKLFYIRSRGISKTAAIGMLIGEIKQHGICWLEASREAADYYGLDWPDDARNATKIL